MRWLAPVLLIVACGSEPEPEVPFDPDAGFEVTANAPGSRPECTSGCKFNTTPRPDITDEDLAALIDRIRDKPVGVPGDDLDTALFYGDLIVDRLAEMPQDDPHVVFLQREINRRPVVEMRLVSDHEGEIVAHFDPVDIPTHTKQHLHFHTEGKLGELVTAGRVERVGLHHLWSRW